LESLRRQSRVPEEFLFVNDRCHDGSARIAVDYAFQVLDLTDDFGLAAGRNLALHHATGDILVGIDADVVIDGDFMAEVQRQFEEHPDLTAMCGRLDELPNNTLPDRWRAVHRVQHLGDQPCWNPMFLFGHSTAGRVAALRQIGGWNPHFRTNGEDHELSCRLVTAGYRLKYVPTCHAWHLRRDTLESLLRTSWNYTYHWQERKGTLDSLGAWWTTRVAVLWQQYRYQLTGDGAQPEISFITLLGVWDAMLRDLIAIQQRLGVSLDLRPFCQAVCTALALCKANSAVVSGVADWLSRLLDSATSNHGIPVRLPPALLVALQQSAVQCLPPAPSYWKLIEESYHRLKAEQGFCPVV
jgi:GT2 family glycosyltransferase